MDILALSYFKKIADLEHFTKAAEELHIAQPSLSRTINSLESELGVKVFDRVGKNIKLNDYGEILLRHTNRILREMEDIQKEIAEKNNASYKTVSILLLAGSKIIPKIVMDFNKIYPDIGLHIVQGNLANGNNETCDLCLYSTLSPIEKTPYAQTLIKEEIFIALPQHHPLAKQASIDLHQLNDIGFICLQKGKSLRNITDIYCEIANFKPKIILESDSPDTVREFVKAGLGTAFIPSITWGSMMKDNLAFLPISSVTCCRYLNLSWKKDGYLSDSSIKFKNAIIDYFNHVDKI